MLKKTTYIFLFFILLILAGGYPSSALEASPGELPHRLAGIPHNVQQEVSASNILTPNGDGFNDYFVVRNIERYPKNQVKIFDKAGRLLYSERNYKNDWAGTVNGSPLVAGTYYYIIDLGDGASLLKGYITIVK